MSDYERIKKAIAYIIEHAAEQPGLNEIAKSQHMSPFHFQRIFSRWAGVTPKRFLQVLTVERAKKLLAQDSSLLAVSDAVGLSSGSRLYDHFVQLEAMTPGQYKNRGVGLTIEYGFHDTPFGEVFIATTVKGICQLSFLDANVRDEMLVGLKHEWPDASFMENAVHTGTLIEHLFIANKTPEKPLSLLVSGTNFQVSVWRALLQVPFARVASYGQIANAIGRPDAARAVGSAIGANPVAFLIPCHRVIQQSGNLGGYHWGLTRKHAMHVWETARYE